MDTFVHGSLQQSTKTTAKSLYNRELEEINRGLCSMCPETNVLFLFLLILAFSFAFTLTFFCEMHLVKRAHHFLLSTAGHFLAHVVWTA